MSLTTYRAPLGSDPIGTFGPTLDAPEKLLYVEPTARWIRGDSDGEVIVDSRNALAVMESDRFVTYYFPLDDVRNDVLVDGAERSGEDLLGQRRYHDLRIGDRTIGKAAWSYPSPTEAGKVLEGHVAFRWDALDRWREEEDELIVHARDPYHRVDALPSSRHVLVRVDGEVVAESHRPVLLFETGLPTRYYLPREDVRADVLRDSDSRTGCPYKGWASYHSVEVNGATHDDLVWFYPDPRHDVAPIADHVCFYNEKVEIEVDGVVEARPVTKWS